MVPSVLEKTLVGSSKKKLWQTLRTGDRIRITGMPSEFMKKPYSMDPETRGLYRRLIEKKIVRTISFIDEWGIPWIEYRWRRKGRMEHHSLALNHGGLKVIRRKDGSSSGS